MDEQWANDEPWLRMTPINALTQLDDARTGGDCMAGDSTSVFTECVYRARQSRVSDLAVPPSGIFQYAPRGVMPRRAGHAATGMRT